MIVTFTDFGVGSPYLGQMRAVLAREAPGVPVIDLFADLPAFDPRKSAYLLPAYAADFPPGTVFLCVVDPGVGTARPPLRLEAEGYHFVGPGNGIFEMVTRRAQRPALFEITWAPPRMSASFHGRDLFAPVAGRLARGEKPAGRRLNPDQAPRFPGWPDDAAEILYFDAYGNAVTGLRAAGLGPEAALGLGGARFPRARVFGEVPEGAGFWYENANGLAEIAVNRGAARALRGAHIGAEVVVY
jgi:S-adenosylmethionine hydrolase